MKMLLGLMAMITAFIATPVSAGPIVVPPGMSHGIVYISPMINGSVVMTNSTSTSSMPITLTNCAIDWIANEQFYLFQLPKVLPIVVKRADFDYLWEKSGDDFSSTLKALGMSGGICVVGPVVPK